MQTPTQPLAKGLPPRLFSASVNHEIIKSGDSTFEYPAQTIQRLLNRYPQIQVELQSLHATIQIIEIRTAELFREKENKVLQADFELRRTRSLWKTQATKDSNTIADLEKANKNLTDLNESCKEYNSLSQNSKDERAFFAQQRDSLLSDIQDLKNKNFILLGQEAEWKSIKERSETFEDAAKTAEEKYNELDLQLKNLQEKMDQMDSLRLENESLHTQLRTASLKLEEQEVKLKENTKQLEQLKEALECTVHTAAKTIEDLNSKIINLQALESEQKSTIEELRQEQVRLKGTRENNVEILEAKKVALEAKVNAMITEHDLALKNKIREVQHKCTQLKNLRDKYEALESDVMEREELQESLRKCEKIAASIVGVAKKRKAGNTSVQPPEKKQTIESVPNPQPVFSSPDNSSLATPPPPPSNSPPQLPTSISPPLPNSPMSQPGVKSSPVR
jgi:myosin heavy subunit